MNRVNFIVRENLPKVRRSYRTTPRHAWPDTQDWPRCQPNPGFRYRSNPGHPVLSSIVFEPVHRNGIRSELVQWLPFKPTCTGPFPFSGLLNKPFPHRVHVSVIDHRQQRFAFDNVAIVTAPRLPEMVFNL